MSQPIIRVGGVPEHFNFPWHLAAEHQLLADCPFTYTWQDYPGGTGAMCRALREGELDLAVVLTEGAVADIIQGSPARILGTYVQSPLTWGVHVHADSPLTHPATLEGKRFAISRYGSGSHLMALVHAQQSGWDTQAMPFVVVQSFEGARQALAAGEADVFMWEKYTTKPTVDRGEWRRLTEVRTPWPCFVLLGRPELFAEPSTYLEDLMYAVRRARYLLTPAQVLGYIAEHYALPAADVAAWYEQTEWLIRPEIGHDTLVEVQSVLQAASVIDEPVALQELVAPTCRLATQHLSAIMYDWRLASTYQMLALRGQATGPLTVEDLTNLGHLDQYHYLGEETSREVVDLLGLQPEDKVLDIGSGVGGTTRVIAHQSGCHAVGVEVQPDLNRLATDLTRRAGLHDRVRYHTADFMRYEDREAYDHFVSLLVFLHLPDRLSALQKSYDLLKPGGRFVIEDMVALQGHFEGEEAYALRHTVSAHSVTSTADYLRDLARVGFIDLDWVDMTPQWQPWTAQRYENFIAEEEFNANFFGPKIFHNRSQFYRTIRDLFVGGNLGGVRITGRKPNS